MKSSNIRRTRKCHSICSTRYAARACVVRTTTALSNINGCKDATRVHQPDLLRWCPLYFLQCFHKNFYSISRVSIARCHHHYNSQGIITAFPPNRAQKKPRAASLKLKLDFTSEPPTSVPLDFANRRQLAELIRLNVERAYCSRVFHSLMVSLRQAVGPLLQRCESVSSDDSRLVRFTRVFLTICWKFNILSDCQTSPLVCQSNFQCSMQERLLWGSFRLEKEF